jgi:hypothetical protein
MDTALLGGDEAIFSVRVQENIRGWVGDGWLAWRTCCCIRRESLIGVAMAVGQPTSTLAHMPLLNSRRSAS